MAGDAGRCSSRGGWIIIWPFTAIPLYGENMGYMRLPSEVIASRSKKKGPRDYLFTQSKWAGIAFISGDPPEQRLVMPGGNVNPHDYFPYFVMKHVDYGIALGLSAWVTLYVFQETNEEAGVILELFSGEKSLGMYAVAAPTQGG
jgi:hypothetical protein